MARSTLKVCSCVRCDAHTGSCPELTRAGRCTRCATVADQARGTAAQRGYTSAGHRAFREAVLARDPFCTVRHPGCLTTATVADHHPLSRRELEARGLDPNDPSRGRGLCHRCHSRETARHQPGGWHN